MEISQISSMVDLINFHWEKDGNENGLLETDEFEDVAKHDQNNDNALSPWEVMEAVNNLQSFSIVHISRLTVFSPTQISYFRENERCEQRSIHLETDTIVRGINFRGGTSLDVYLNLQLNDGLLAEDTRIGGILFRASPYDWVDRIFFNCDGAVRIGTLAEDTTIQGIEFGEGTGVSFFDDGNIMLADLNSGVTIDGLAFGSGTRLYFYESGHVESGVLTNNTVVQDIFFRGCGSGTFGGVCGARISFYESGKVASGTLVEDAIIDGMRLFSIINFYENGGIKSGNLAEDTIINGIKFDGGRASPDVEFYENGQVSSASLAEDTTIQGIRFIGGGYFIIKFYEDGKVKEGSLAEGALIEGLVFSGSTRATRVWFYEDGKINGLFTHAYTNVHVQESDLNLRGFDGVWFHENGRVLRGTLAENTVIRRINFNVGDLVELDRRGRIISR